MKSLLLLTAITLAAQPKTFDIQRSSIADIQAAVAAGALTYEGLVRLYLNRIKAYDKQGPRLNAIIHLNPNALETARALDTERRANGPRGPLHGIPIAVKDNFDTFDMPTSGGNLPLAGSIPAHDATVIGKLRAAGAIILCKTNMDEMAMGAAGLSGAGGQTLNPYDTGRGPGGSSAGSAVAVNAAFATVALGTETGVSVRGPAANNALIGIAPTRGLVSRAGVVPLSFTQDRVGVHAKSVADAALVLAAIRGLDPADLATQQAQGHSIPEIPIAGARLGVLRDLFRNGDEFLPANQLIDARLQTLAQLKASIVDGLSLGFNLINLLPNLRVNTFEVRAAFDTYLRQRTPPPPVKSLAEMVALKKHLPGLNTRLTEAPSLDSLNADAEYLGRLKSQQVLRQQLIELMDRHQLDALVYPMKSLTAPLAGASDDGPRDNPVSAVTGLPAIVAPAGYAADGLPIAIEFLGRPNSDQILIGFARAYEQAAKIRVPPKSTPPLPGDIFTY